MEERSQLRTVVLANFEEYVSPLFSRFPSAETAAWISQCRAESEMALYWEGDDKLVISTHPFPDELVEAAHRALGYKNISFLFPKRHSHSLCEDVLADRKSFETLCCVLSSAPTPRLAVWGATPQLYRLIEKIREFGIADVAVDVPERNAYWTVPYLDSKSGFRDFVDGMVKGSGRLIRLPPGITCCDIATAVAATVSRWRQGSGVVVKADRGVAGVGLLMLQKVRMRRSADPAAFLRAWARTQPLIEAGPLVVEEYVDAGESVKDAPSASIQGFIDQQGKMRLKALSVQALTTGGSYVGASIGRTFFMEGDTEQLRDLGRQVGVEVGRLGFRGHFGIDTIRARGGTAICTEFNARRTSVCAAIDIASHVLGPNFEDDGAVATSERCLLSAATNGLSAAQAVKRLDPIMLKPRRGGTGIVPTILGSLQHYARRPTIGFVAIAKDAETARAVHREAVDRLMVAESTCNTKDKTA